MPGVYDISEWKQFLEEINEKVVDVANLIKEQGNAAESIETIERRIQEEVDTQLNYRLPAGFVIDKFEILKEIGGGGMSQVYLARRNDGLFDQQVAIKLLAPDLVGQKHNAYFENERKILARLNHPNISKILDGGLIDDIIPYFVMDYVEGVTLSKFLSEGQYSLKERLVIFKEICKTVLYAHSQFILHRDLKPSNVFLNKEGAVKLLDFGIGEFIKESKSRNREGGTMQYLTPEYFTRAAYSTRSDIYQLGLLGYYIFEGRAVFPEGDREELIHRIKSGGIESWDRIRSKRRLKAILTKCLQTEPDDRYDTVDALLIDLGFYEEDKPVKALKANWGWDGLLFIKRNKLSLTFSLLLFLSLITSAIWSSVQANRIYSEKQRALNANEFLLNIFKANDPDVTHGEEVTALSLLKNAEVHVNRLENLELRADMLKQLGVLYHSLGENTQSINYSTQAIDLYEAQGTFSFSYIRSLVNLSNTWSNLGSNHKADSVLQETFHIVDYYHVKDPLLLSDLLYYYAHLKNGQANFMQADSAIRTALALLDEVTASDFSSEKSDHENIHVHEAMLYSLWSQVQVNQSRLEEALLSAKRAVSIIEKNEPRSYSYALFPFYYLAIVYNAIGEYEGAKEIYEEIAGKNLETFGLDHPDTWNALRLLSITHSNLENYQVSDSIYRFLLPNFVNKYGEMSPKTLELIFYMARSQLFQGSYAQAKKMFLQLLIADEKILGLYDVVIGDDCEQLGIVETYLGNYTQAEDYFLRSERIYEKYVDKKNDRFVTLYYHFGNLYKLTRNYQMAIKYYDKSLSISEKIYDVSHVKYQKALEKKREVKEMEKVRGDRLDPAE